MNLIIDIGNTCAKLIAFKGSTIIDECITSNKTLEDLTPFSRKHIFNKGIVSSVLGFTNEINKRLTSLNIPILKFTSTTPTPLINDYKTPQTLGTDRLAAAVGAYSLYPKKDLLVIDAGTCITYDIVNNKGHYLGGAISPGMQMRFKALHTFTAQLPQVDNYGDVPDIGYDTETSIRLGVIKGIEAEIEGRIKSLKEKYPLLLVFLTGGDTFNFDNSIKNCIFADKYIVARGLNRILEYNNEFS